MNEQPKPTVWGFVGLFLLSPLIIPTLIVTAIVKIIYIFARITWNSKMLS
jgi:hypothetical protein